MAQHLARCHQFLGATYTQILFSDQHHQQAKIQLKHKHPITYLRNQVLFAKQQQLLQETTQSHIKIHKKEALDHNLTVATITITTGVHSEEAMVDNIITTMEGNEIMIVVIITRNGINIVEALITEIHMCNLQEVFPEVVVTCDLLYILLLHLSLHKCLFKCSLLATT